MHVTIRRVVVRAVIGFCIVASMSVFAIWRVEAIAGQRAHDRQVADTRQRIHDAAAIERGRKHDVYVNALARYNLCTFVNAKVIDPFRKAVETLAAPIPEAQGGTDPATLARIRTTNAQRAAALGIIEGPKGVRHAECGNKPAPPPGEPPLP